MEIEHLNPRGGFKNSDTVIFICSLPWCFKSASFKMVKPFTLSFCSVHLILFFFLFHILVSLLVFSTIWEHWSHLLRCIFLSQLKQTQNKLVLLVFHMSSLGFNKINGTEGVSNFEIHSCVLTADSGRHHSIFSLLLYVSFLATMVLKKLIIDVSLYSAEFG